MMKADIAQIIDAGWRAGKSAAEVAAEIVKECDGPAATPPSDTATELRKTAADLINETVEDKCVPVELLCRAADELERQSFDNTARPPADTQKDNGGLEAMLGKIYEG